MSSELHAGETQEMAGEDPVNRITLSFFANVTPSNQKYQNHSNQRAQNTLL
jgi:hypothetical protein